MFVVPLQVYGITRSSLAVGAIGVAQMVPTVTIGLLGGAIADAVDRRKLVLGNLEAGALGSLTSPAISALAGGLITVAGAVVIGLTLPAFTRYRPQPRTKPQHPQPARSAAGANG